MYSAKHVLGNQTVCYFSSLFAESASFHAAQQHEDVHMVTATHGLPVQLSAVYICCACRTFQACPGHADHGCCQKREGLKGWACLAVDGGLQDRDALAQRRHSFLVGQQLPQVPATHRGPHASPFLPSLALWNPSICNVALYRTMLHSSCCTH